MDGYKELIVELNKTIEKVVTFEKEVLDNKIELEKSIDRAKKFILDQTKQYDRINDFLDSNVAAIDSKFNDVLSHVEREIDFKLTTLIDNRVENIKSTLLPLESRMKESNDMIESFKEFVEPLLANGINNAFKAISEIDTKVKKQGKMINEMGEIIRFLSEMNKSNIDIIKNIKTVENNLIVQNKNLNERIDKIVDVQNEIIKLLV